MAIQSIVTGKFKKATGLTVHFKNLQRLSENLEAENVDMANCADEEEQTIHLVEEAEVKEVRHEEDQRLGLRDKTSKWFAISLSSAILCFFFYDAIWADPYLSWRYYKVKNLF